MRKLKILILLLWCSAFTFSQNNAELIPDIMQAYQDTLRSIENTIFKGLNDAEKYAANQKFIAIFEKALRTEESFTFSFDSLQAISKLQSSDKQLKIYNWNLPKDDGTHEYFGFIQKYNEKTKRYDLFPLVDKSAEMKNPENTTTDNKHWFGMLYYKIIVKKYKKKNYYTLLAWDGNDKLSSKKIIDVLYFTNDGTPRFGDDIFKMNTKKYPKRIIFEYSSSIVMSLKYNEQQDKIIFDHLAPSNPSLKDQYQYYGPDFSYDAFEFKKGKWVYIEDVDARNEKNHRDNLYNPPKEELR